jgi:hypothetical protein
MPELHDSNPPATPPIPPSFFAASPAAGTPPDPPASPPPEVKPDPPSMWDWEKAPAFRNTFLYHFKPEDRTTFTHLGRLLYDLIIEAPAMGADDPGSSTRAELRAAVQDLAHLGAFLASVGKEHKVSSLDSQDERLSRKAGPWAIEAVRLAVKIGGVLESEPPEPPSEPAVRFKERG